MTQAPTLSASTPIIDVLHDPLYASVIGLALVAIAAWWPRTWFGLVALLPLAFVAFFCLAFLLFFGFYILADANDDTFIVACLLLPAALTCVGVALWLRPRR